MGQLERANLGLIADDSTWLLTCPAALTKVVRMQFAAAVVAVTPVLLNECLAFDHVAVGGSVERQSELSSAAKDSRMRVATLDGRAVGLSVMAPWFFEVPFLALV